jgi:hypothetical protein
MRSRRAVSSVVGMVFAIVALTTTITYISYSMGVLNNFGQSVLVKNQQLTDVDKETFQISSVTVPNGRLNITLADTGSLPINFTKIWIQNTTATDWTHGYVPTNNFVSPGGILTNVGQSIPVSINPAYSYNVKLVTSRGNTQEVILNSASVKPIAMQLFALPDEVPNGFDTTLLFAVTNNMTNNGGLANLQPSISVVTSGATATLKSGPTPSTSPFLAQGNTVYFKYVYTISGKAGQSVTFTLSLQNGYPGNVVSNTVAVSDISASSSNWSTTWGILSINYTTLQWSQNNGVTWNNAWSVPGSSPTVWRLNVTNNDPSRPFILNGNSTMLLANAQSANTIGFWMISPKYPPLTAYPDDSQTISPGVTGTIYFGANSGGGSNKQNTPSSGNQYAVSILLYGYWNSVSGNNFFGQNIPYEGIVTT